MTRVSPLAGDKYEVFHESGRRFRFPAGQVFKADAVAGKGLQGVKGCDFVWKKRTNQVWVIEVKTSAPRAGDRLDAYMGDIVTQFLHGTLVWLAGAHGRHTGRFTLPKSLKSTSALKAKPRLVLVVMDLPQRHAQNLQLALQTRVRAACRAFDMDQPQVLSGEAIERKLPVVSIDDDPAEY
jgi:hypothetical protein